MNENRIYKIINPPGVKLIVSMGLLITILLINIMRDHEDKNSYYYFSITWLVVCSIVLFISIFRTYVMRSSEIKFDKEGKVFVVNGKEWNADEMEQLMINHEKNPVVGIKPKGKKIVPLHLCFRFMEDHEEGIRQLENWANERHMKISKGFFMRWM